MTNDLITTASSPRAKPPMQARPRKKRAFRFSDDFLAKYKLPEGRREVILFEEGTGLGIRVSQTGVISFIVQLRLKDDGGRHRETLGVYGKLTIEAAREAAQALAGKIAMGVNPKAEARAKAAQEAAEAAIRAEAEEMNHFTLHALTELWWRRHLKAKRPQYATPTTSEADFATVAPAFLTDKQAAEYLGLTPHQLYLYRRGKKAEGPPFTMYGARIRYPVAGLRQWAASLPQFTNRAQAYAANPKRAKGAARQRSTTAHARQAKVEKRGRRK